jgi:NAD(P)-dependent dehydrogenase (short-subunit alcohol dehydrogenase family)
MPDVFANDCLAHRTAVISGGLGALGSYIAHALHAKGADVTVTDLAPESEVDGAQHGGDRYYQCDVTDEDSVEAVFDAIQDNTGRAPDAVFVHAGLVQDFSLDTYELSDWEHLQSVNVRGAFLTARAAVRRMQDRQSVEQPGKLIFTTSWVKDVPWPRLSGYNSSKAAIEQFMRTIAREYASSQILCNAIAPGMVAVGMAQRQYDTDPQYKARADQAIPLGRLQPPESVADAAVYLASDATNYMTGQTLLIDGGASLYPMI